MKELLCAGLAPAHPGAIESQPYHVADCPLGGTRTDVEVLTQQLLVPLQVSLVLQVADG
jgi:hypothetical protein